MPSPITTTSKFLPLGALAILGLASCSMPADQAWRQIRQDGLIPYLMQNPAESAQDVGALASTSKPTPVQATNTVTTPSSSSSVISVPPPSQLASQSLPTAQSVPGLEGYVRSPFTNPPRLVDVRGMAVGSKVVCPYTRRPFLVPQGAQSTQAVASTTPSAPQPQAQPTLPKPQPEQPKPQAPVTPPPTVPTKVAANTAPAPTPPPAPQVKPTPAPTAPAPSTPPPAPKPAVANELPFGSPIPGRPGFVNSPYAAKHQLVDVTGLPTGMEVKCPYTGKLFRVPPGANGSPAAQPQKQ